MWQAPDENTAEGWNQIGESCTQVGKNGDYWLRQVVEASLKPGGQGISAGIGGVENLNASVSGGMHTGVEAKAMLEGCDFNFDMPDTSSLTQNMPVGDVAKSMIPGGDVASAAAPTLDAGAPTFDGSSLSGTASVGDMNMDVSHSLVSGGEAGLSAPGGTGTPGMDSMLSSASAPAGDMGGLLPGADKMLPGGMGGAMDSLGGVMDSIGDAIGQAANIGMGFLSGLFQFLFNFFTETLTEVGNQISEGAAAAASEAAKKLKDVT